MNTTAPIADQLQERRRTQTFLTTNCTPVRDDDAVIGWIAKADYPADTWIAIMPDLNDTVNDPQLPQRWSRELPSAEHAEARVRSHYRRWIGQRSWY